MHDAPTPVLHFLGLPVMVSESYPACSIRRYRICNTDGRHDRWIVGTDAYRELAESAGRGGKAVEWVTQPEIELTTHDPDRLREARRGG